jgi:esterase
MELNHRIYGEGKPIVILHGLFGTLDNWQGIAKILAEHNMVIAVDLRNHGKSPHTSDTFDYPSLAEDVKEFMETHWIHQAIILGHSMGGKVAMQLAIDYPEMVENLIVVDIAPKDYSGGHESVLNALEAVNVNTLETRTQADEIFEDYGLEYSTRQFLLKNLTRNEDGGFVWKMNLEVLIRDYANILMNVDGNSTYTGPTLFIKGEKSNYIDENEMESYRFRFPTAQLSVIAEAGHWVHADRPESLVGVVKEWIG